MCVSILLISDLRAQQYEHDDRHPSSDQNRHPGRDTHRHPPRHPDRHPPRHPDRHPPRHEGVDSAIEPR